MLCIAVLVRDLERGIDVPSFSPTSGHHLTCYTLPVVEMAFFSNSSVIVSGGIFNLNAVEGDFHINNKDSGMHDSGRSEEHPY